ncbi:hypothetical protein IPV08_00755 [Methylobacterium sp. SD274]|uniref:hypothetical protein n=1 Tax=Methylobacterium sp. SD274 TaxID=2782009 RepID=UPI001A95BC6E|nr:hypothetical protein [Methylobacterium sp. SD274]MBO1018498.1 hypothetical protein [Methylobacterium sp. SD274]
MLKPWILLAACLAAFPASAAPIEENEPLVMRIIFEDCLGYIRHGRTPFRGLATRPASREAIDTIPHRAPDREKAVELLSPRYVASWGQDNNGRHCLIRTVWQAEPDARPMRLGVRSEGFLQRVDARARAEGLTSSGMADAFTPISVSSWSEGETGHDSGPLRPVSFSLVASAADEARGLADAGVIAMGGPPQGRP